MAATVEVEYYFGTAESTASQSLAEANLKFNREDTLSGVTAIPIPTAGPATNFSWQKLLALKVTATASTQLSNRGIRTSAAVPATGLLLHWKDLAAFASSGAANASQGANSATPTTGYASLPSTNVTYYSNSASATSTGRNGDFVGLILGVDFNATQIGAGQATLPNIIFQYDEAHDVRHTDEQCRGHSGDGPALACGAILPDLRHWDR